MTTVVSDIVEDYKVVPDTDDYSSPNQVFFLDTPQVFGGLLNSAWETTPRICSRDVVNVYGDIKGALVEKNSPSDAGGECGPALLDENGNGYELKVVYTETRIHIVNAGVRGIALGGQVNIESDAGEVFALYINADGQMTATQGGVDLGHEVTDTTYPASTLTPGQFSDRNSSGGGFQSGVLSWGGDGVVSSNPSLVNINTNDTIEIGSTNNTLNTSNLEVGFLSIGTLPVALTEIDPDQHTFSQPWFTDFEIYPPLGTVQALAATGSDPEAPDYESATKNVTLQLPAGWSGITYGALSDDPDSLASMIEGATIETGDIHYYRPADITLYDDSTFSGAPSGTVETWLRKSATNMMIQVLIINGVPVVPGGNWAPIEFIEKIDFIG